ncbi:hypothetical protein PEL8287_02099 [Roseovarius litorisediminis]|uniref:Uncharacterized protein n=1 Tax=Roseovarius litorisediminis TaxID=1312363 RepID=A0A1Y5SIP3_9RHOB|nr:hypothetical protein [Roseovarius litorisediminis]SLN41724.1 hypothetical protein PEL8287_02099 [Roseovarius litorisediminis]
MSKRSKGAPDPLAYLPHEGREFSGHPPVDAQSPEIAEQTADRLIRRIMVEQKREVSHKSLPDLIPDISDDVLEPAPKKVRHPRRTNPHIAKVQKKLVIPVLSRLSPSRGLIWLSDKVVNYTPTRKHSIIAVLALIMVLRPWFLPVFLFVSFWVILISYFSLGPDRVAELLVGLWQRIDRRNPKLAESIRQRAEAGAERIDAFMDRLPAKWTEGYQSPDFSRLAEPDPVSQDQLDPFDRIAAEAQQG